MKLAEFDALCDEQWEERKGDILDLYLTDDSAAELHRDMLLAPQREKILMLTEDDVRKIREGGMFPYVTNPITRTRVPITSGAPKDQAHVGYVVEL